MNNMPFPYLPPYQNQPMFNVEEEIRKLKYDIKILKEKVDKLENKTYKVDEKEAQVIREIFKLRGKGLSLKAIGNEVGMSKQRVHYILKNQMYKGKFVYDGEVEHNNISYNVDRIVSDYIFNKVNR